MEPKTIKIFAIIGGLIGLVLAGIGIYYWVKEEEKDGDGDGNKSNSLKSRIAAATSAVMSGLNQNSQNAQAEAETDAIKSEQDTELLLQTSSNNEDTLNSAITLIETTETTEGSIDPIFKDAVATMETQVDESNLISEEAALANLEIQEVMAETEGSNDITESFVVEYMAEEKSSTERTQNTDRVSNSTHQNRVDGVERKEPAPSNTVDEKMSVEATERASQQGVRDSENDKRNSAARAMNASRREFGKGKRLEKVKEMKDKFAQRKQKTTSRIEKTKNLASSPKLNEKQKKVEERLLAKIRQREQKMASIEQKLAQKREARYSKKQARDLIKQIRLTRIAVLKTSMEEKKRNISDLNRLIRATLSGDGDSESQYEELVKLLTRLNPEMVTANNSNGNGNGNGNSNGTSSNSNSNGNSVYEVGVQVNTPTTTEPFTYVN